MHDDHILNRTHNRLTDTAGALIYGGRWLIAPMYVGLLAPLVIYTLRFLIELYDFCIHGMSMSAPALTLAALSFIDTVMLGNLLLLIMIGSYSVFIKKLEFPAQNRPQWLDHISSGMLKVKMSTSVIGVSLVHLVKTFMDSESASPELMIKQSALHIVFIISGIAVAYIDKLSHNTSMIEPPHNDPNH